MTNDYKNCTYLAAPKILRTQKFCCAIAQGPAILSTQYLEACLEEKTLLPPEDYLLEDKAGESRYGIQVDDVVERAKANRGRLLRGQPLWVTEGLDKTYESYRSIIEANGGTCSLFRGRAGSIATRTASVGDEDEGESEDHAVLISGSAPADARLWPKFCEMATGAGLVPRIVKTDWLLDLALTQQIQWKEDYAVAAQDFVSERQAV
jgi:hypothetical protein